MRSTFGIVLFTLAFLFLCAEGSRAQVWLDYLDPSAPKGPPVLTGESRNFYDIQRAFERYVRAKGAPRRGWKQFRRWESFWEPRVYPAGDFPPPVARLRAIQASRPKGPHQELARWQSLGPSTIPGGGGVGRINCVAFHPANEAILYVGTAGGGLWKSTDGGQTWHNLALDFPVLGISDIAVDPANPDTVYVATGDHDAKDNYSLGVLKTTDGGQTWALTGLRWEDQHFSLVSRILVDPRQPEVVLASTNRGIWRSEDAGDHWSLVFPGGHMADMELQASADSTTVYAAAWKPTALFRSVDGGRTWSQLTQGLPPADELGRCALACSSSSPGAIYALFSDSLDMFHSVYRTRDGGDTWARTTPEPAAAPNLLGWNPDGSDRDGGQGWYDLALAVSPQDPDHVIVGGVNIWQSRDGGATWTASTYWLEGEGLPYVHADQHMLAFSPGGQSLYSCNDGGLTRTRDGGATWSDLSDGLTISQFYSLSSGAPGRPVVAGAQDNGTVLSSGPGSWRQVFGGDGMECLVDPRSPSRVLASIYFGRIFESTDGGSNFVEITPPGQAGRWVTPYVMHPADSSTLYAGYEDVVVTRDGGANWSVAAALGSLTGGDKLASLAVAPSQGDVLYAATMQRLFTNASGSWSEVTAGLPTNLAALSSVTVHPKDPRAAWVTLSGYQEGLKVYATTDGGATWSNVSAGLPNIPANALAVHGGSGDLYVGTDIGVFYKPAQGGNWTPFMGPPGARLPHVVVRKLEIVAPADGPTLLRIATFGRGAWDSPLAAGQAAPAGQGLLVPGGTAGRKSRGG